MCKEGKASAETFAGQFCSLNGLAPERYAQAVLRRSLHTPARLLMPLLSLSRGYFASDLDFIAGVGRIRRLRELDLEAHAFIMDPRNRGFLRTSLKLRVSVSRLQRLVRLTLRGSRQPFPAGP